MNDLNFDIYAMVSPKNKTDYIALLDEALLMADQLHEMLDENERILKEGK